MQPELFDDNEERKSKLGHADISYVRSGSILTETSGFMAGYDYSLNPYSGCSFGCTYCYAAFFSRDKDKMDNWGYWVSVEPKNKITILEFDNPLFKALTKKVREIAETDTILRLKGLEKKCVVWSTAIKIDHNEEINNFVYTILTRTCGVLVIAILKDQVVSEYLPVIKELRKDRLILWDKETKAYYNSI